MFDLPTHESEKEGLRAKGVDLSGQPEGQC